MEDQPKDPMQEPESTADSADVSATDAVEKAEPAPDPDEAGQVVVEDVQPEDPAAEEPSEQTADAGPAAEGGPESGPALDPAASIEAVLFAADTALTAARIGQITKIPSQKTVKEILRRLNEKYEQAPCAFRIEALAGGFQMLTQPQFAEILKRLYKVRSETKLTGASLETLSIVAYKQPILRADVEAIRGVASGEVLRTLMERQLVKIVGRAEIVGRPMLYGTTKKFLEVFGLSALEDLPKAEELRSLFSEPAKSPAPAEAASAPAESPETANQDEPAAQSSDAAAPASGDSQASETVADDAQKE